MTVAELIAQLQAMPQDSIVILQRDPEGNGYSPLHVADADAVYCERDAEVYSTKWTAADACMEEAHWESFKASTPPCVVLAPKY